MAGETVGGEFCVPCHQRTGADHEVRVREDQRQQYEQVHRNDDEQDGALLQFQPQKSRMATMWAVARTLNASVIGKCTTRHFLTASKVRLSQ